ncbi:MAG: S-adenosyl-l-methionine hydroxide adenosyltransferase family protein [Archaeoglobaceae archaeon]|nr:S-adenosyl-l-methionine hydroxide adenosyltransferase family protein [Archaeoglobaceae archaeon]
MIITLLTDFGDFYPGVMKGVIYSITPEAKIVDITHSVETHNIFQGAFLLYHSYKYFTRGIHVAVVDPGVGGKRRAIVVQTKNHYFIAPDNGIVYPSASEDGIVKIFEIDNRVSKFVGDLSHTFHGRDIFAPCAALLLKGDFRFLNEIDELKKMDIFDYKIVERKIRCRVAFVDRFGNIVTNLPMEAVKSAKGFNISGIEFPIVRTYEEVAVGEPLALIGSFKTIELSVREGSASDLLKIRRGIFEMEVLE